jgi:hypothetical protein
MLTYLLAIAVFLGSLGLYLTAFFFPELHRKADFVWSGIGLFYGLVLWACGGRITGGVLLGQMASVSLLGWLGWQTLQLRREQVPLEQRSPIPTTAEGWGQLVQVKVREWEIYLQHSEWPASMPRDLRQLLEWVTKRWVKVLGWFEALLSTSLKPMASPPPVTPPPGQVERQTQIQDSQTQIQDGTERAIAPETQKKTE